MYAIIIEQKDDLMHVGKGHDDNPPGRGSGRYPYGSGERPFQSEYGEKHDKYINKQLRISNKAWSDRENKYKQKASENENKFKETGKQKYLDRSNEAKETAKIMQGARKAEEKYLKEMKPKDVTEEKITRGAWAITKFLLHPADFSVPMPQEEIRRRRTGIDKRGNVVYSQSYYDTGIEIINEQVRNSFNQQIVNEQNRLFMETAIRNSYMGMGF